MGEGATVSGPGSHPSWVLSSVYCGSHLRQVAHGGASSLFLIHGGPINALLPCESQLQSVQALPEEALLSVTS